MNLLGLGLAVAFLSVLLVEVALRLPLGPAIGRMLDTVKRTSSTLRRSGASDRWKEKAMLGYSARTLKSAVALLACMAILGGVALGVSLVLETVLPGFIASLASLPGLLGLAAVSSIHLILRLRSRNG